MITIDDTFDPSSPYFNGAIQLSSPPGARNGFTEDVSLSALSAGNLSNVRVATSNLKLYEAVVDASGNGDYTNLNTAITAGKKNIYIRNGTYSLTSAIYLASNTNIIGESRDGVILDFTGATGTNGIRTDNYTTAYTTGTITGAAVSALNDVNGSGTSWLTNATAGQYIRIQDSFYLIASVDSDTKITLVQNFNGDTAAASFGAYAIVSMTKNVSISDITITGSSSAHNIFLLSVGNTLNMLVSNCYFLTVKNAVSLGEYLENVSIASCFFENMNHMITTTGTRHSNVFITRNHFKNSIGSAINFDGDGFCITENIFAETYSAISGANNKNNLISNNKCIYATGGLLQVNLSDGDVFSNNCITGNLVSNGWWGILVLQNNGASGTGIFQDNTVVGNQLAANKYGGGAALDTPYPHGFLVDTAGISFEGNTICGNSPEDPQYVSETVVMKNVSGGTVNAGNLVTFSGSASTADGTAKVLTFTTTATQGNNKVFGMLINNCAANAFGRILTRGKTIKMTVDGTTDIAIGDYIGCFTTAGIGMKCSSGDTAIAIALEAYTTNDSSGVIDAIIISPRAV